MSDSNDITGLANIENNIEEIHRIRDEELLKIYKFELILSIIKKAELEKFQIPEKENLQKSVKLFSVQNYLKLDDDLSLLGINKCKTINISYTERKAILNYVKEEIPNQCKPIINYLKSVEKEWPDIFKQEQKHQEILVLEEKRKTLHLKLAEMKLQKCNLLKSIANLKIGPYLKNELNLRYSNCKLNQMKGNALKGFLVKEFCSSTDHTMKAIKEITKYIEEELEE